MTYNEYLLTKLSEECAELAQAASKLNLFGIYSYNPFDPLKVTNQDNLKNEFNDVLATIDMLMESMNIDITRDEKMIDKKRLKMIDMWCKVQEIKQHEPE